MSLKELIKMNNKKGISNKNLIDIAIVILTLVLLYIVYGALKTAV